MDSQKKAMTFFIADLNETVSRFGLDRTIKMVGLVQYAPNCFYTARSHRVIGETIPTGIGIVFNPKLDRFSPSYSQVAHWPTATD